MTEHDLAPLAKAGNRAAVNELLRRSRADVCAVVVRVLRQQRVSFDLYDDACAEGLIAAWRSLPAWDPSRAPLASFAETNVRRAVWRLAAIRGYAVSIPVARARKRASAIHSRAEAVGAVQSLDRPQYAATETEDSPPMVETLPGRGSDADGAIDLRMVLARLDDREREALLMDSEGESKADIGRALGISREYARNILDRAIARARQATIDPFRRAA